MDTQAIEVQNVTKAYGEKQVLKDVNFSIKKNSIFALLGSNGAGKTTVIKILSTLLRPDGGSIRVKGFDVIHEAAQVRKHISLTGQFVAVDEVLTAKENLTLIGHLRHLSDVKRTVEEWIDFMKLNDAPNKKVASYSGGMQRRLDIAMSLMGNPDILFLDEPTTGLDPQNRIAMWDFVKKLSRQGTTVFLTTQYLEEAEYLADTIAILHEGKIIAEGSPKQLKEIMPEKGVQVNFSTNLEADRAIEILNKNGIVPSNIEISLPTLENVFLHLVDQREEGGKNDES